MPNAMKHPALIAFLAGSVCGVSSLAHADDAALSTWADGIKFSGQIDAGATYNADSPNDRKNFGRLFDDKSNEALLNQILLTAQRPIDPSLKDYDYGFKLQGLYGSDARVTHFLRELENVAGDSVNQFDIVEANVQVHTPWFTDGGFDIKAGQYPSPQSAESIDPSSNIFYSHSYIFNFGVPFKHTGVLTTLHATPHVDVYLGADTGVNTSLGNGDNNDSLSFFGGLGLNFLDGKWTTLATTHIGPEIADLAKTNGLVAASVDPDSDKRFLTDITSTWKATDQWTFITDLNWIHDEALNAGSSTDAYGIAQYATYAVSDHLSVSGRGEVFRDEDGLFVAQAGNNIDYANGQEGIPARSARSVGGGRTTYGALTLGLSYKPTLPTSSVTMTVRPEIRYDKSLSGTNPFNDSSDNDMFTAGVDIILGF